MSEQPATHRSEAIRYLAGHEANSAALGGPVRVKASTNEILTGLTHAILALTEPAPATSTGPTVLAWLSTIDADALREQAMARLTGMDADPVTAVLAVLADEARDTP